MPCTRLQSRKAEQQSHPLPSVHDGSLPASVAKKKRKKRGGKAGEAASSASEASGPASSTSPQQPLPTQFTPPPRASVEALTKLFRPLLHDARRAAAAAKQVQEAQARITMGPPRPTKCTPAQRQRWEQIFVGNLQCNAPHFAALIEARNSFADTALRDHVQSTIDAHPDLPPPAPPSGFISWLLNIVANHPSLPDYLTSSVTRRRHRKDDHRNLRRDTAANYRVFRTPLAYAQFHVTVLHLWLFALPTGQEYPPRGHWLVETQEIYDLCLPFLENQKLADSRRNRFPVHFVQEECLQYVVPEGLTCLIFDRKTKALVTSVIRNFSRSPSLLDWVTSVVQEGVDTRKSVRLEDSGSIVLIGFSAGARSRPLFALARNLLRKSTDTSVADVNNAAVSAFFWKHAQMLHPHEVADSIEAFNKEFNFPSLDPGWPYSRAVSGDLPLPTVEGDTLTFSDVEFGPGCMVYVQRYARPTHRENQPHIWSVLWTTLREGTNPSGNNFFLSNYGICIKQATDTSIAWKPSQYHTSSIGSWDPKNSWARGDDPVMNQQGIAFVTSNRVPGVWLRWADENVPAQERFERAMAELELVCQESEVQTD